MLNSLTIKNYKCFEDFVFDFDPDVRAMLLLGNNGAGKTSLADALEVFQRIGRGEGQARRLLYPDQRWDENNPVEFKLSSTLNDVLYEYAFSFDFSNKFKEFRILSETLKCDKKTIYRRERENIFWEDNTNSDFSYDGHVLFLPTFHKEPLREHINTFRSWLGNMLILAPSPKDFKDESGTPSRWPSRDCSNCVSWLAHILDISPKTYSVIENYLQNVWEDFHTISNKAVVSDEVRRLRLEFKNTTNKNKTEFSPALNSLSDGEKCLFLSAVVMAAHEVNPSIFCFWDKPDSYLSLSETGHFIHAMRGVFSKNGQLLVTSHNTEVINAFTESSTWVMGRKDHLSPVKPLKRVSDMRGSEVLPKKASFIHALAAGEIRI